MYNIFIELTREQIMKIPSKITKLQHTTMSKKNFKYLTNHIADVNGDLLLEANWLNEDWDPNNKHMDNTANENKDTVEFWHKETKVAFREFKRDKIKIDKAYAKYLETKEKGKK